MRNLLPLVLLVPFIALAQPKGAVVMDQQEAVVTVTKVDAQAKNVTVRGPRGNLQTLHIPEAQNLERVKPGDRYKITYAEAAIVALTRGGGEPAAAVDETVQVAPRGAKPGGFKVRTYSASGVIDAIDYKNRYIAVRGPKGNTLALPVSGEVKDLDKLKVGDKISVAYSQAIAFEMVEQPKPQKPAAKKKT